MAYNTIPGIDDTTKEFAPEVRDAIAESDELVAKYARLQEGDLVVGTSVINTP